MTLVDHDHIAWKPWKLIARHPPTPSGTWENFDETRGGMGKSGVLEHKSGNISCKDRRKVTMEGL